MRAFRSTWVFDNEEIGSSTRQGADSTLLADTLRRITAGLGLDERTYLEKLSQSFLLSADNAHAMHPNYPDKCDPVNRPRLGGGVVLKYSGSQKYTTDGASGAIARVLAEKAGIRLQTFANHSDIPGGTTLEISLSGTWPSGPRTWALPSWPCTRPMRPAAAGIRRI